MAQSSAENDSTVSEDTVNKLESGTEDNNILGENQTKSFKDLQEEIYKKLGEDNTINLEYNYTYYDNSISTPLITINSDIVIDGGGLLLMETIRV